MKKTYLFALFCLLILRGSTTAQNIYESIGKKVEVLTLSNGQYQEIFPNDTLVRIGSVLFNTVTQEVVEFVEKSDADSYVAADVASRFLSVDPIGRQYPELTPYQFASNRPIDGSDLDGKEYKNETKVDLKNNTITEISVVKYYAWNRSNIVSNAKFQTTYLPLINEQLRATWNSAGSDNCPQEKGDPLSTNYSMTLNVYEISSAKSTLGAPYVMNLEDQDRKKNSWGGTMMGNTQDLGNAGGAVGEYDVDKLGKIKKGSGTAVNEHDVARTIVHEILHDGGEPHVWDSRSSEYPVFQQAVKDIKDGNQDSEAIKKIKDNIMNSGGNPIPQLQSNSGTQLTSRQRDSILMRIKEKQGK